MLDKKDNYIEVFMGTTYKINLNEIKTLGDFKSVLEQIVKDLPKDDELEIGEIDLRDGEIRYILKEGIFQ